MRTLRFIALGLLALIVLVVVGVSLWVGDQYRQLIYPGVTVTAPFADTVDVGGLSRSAARTRITGELPAPDQRGVAVQIGDESWDLSWAEVGQAYDIDAAVDAAYRVDRDRPWWLAVFAVLRPTPHVVEAPLQTADPASVRAFVETVAEEVATTPQDAAIDIVESELIVTPATPGRHLDVDAATGGIQVVLAQGQPNIVLQSNPISPRIETAEPAATEARSILSAPFVLRVHDPLTGDLENGGYRAEFTAEPQEVSRWLSFVERGDQYHLNVSPTAIRAWVETIAPHVNGDVRAEAESADESTTAVGEVRSIDVDATAARIAETLRATASGSAQTHEALAVVRHPAHTYIVQPGDVFYDIAYLHGFPQWQLEKANPEVDPGLIDVGQELTIPSIDVLFPHPLIPEKRIEVDLPTQTLVAYEGDTQLFELKVSSGISKTPTLAGQFQILFKEEEAFAQRWSLDMPYFMGFYEEGEDFYNGFHELPITAYGTRLSAGVLGYPASFGCIILDVGAAEALYNWADVGTLVRVHGVAPGTPFGQQTLDDIAPLEGDQAP